MGVLAAYIHRLKTGRGQMVDTSLLEAGIVQTYWQSAIALATGTAPGPMGSAHPLNAPYQAFETADGWIVIGGSNQSNWLRALEALEAQHLADDPRFRDNAARMGHLEELEAALAPYFKARSSADLLARLEAEGVPAGPVYDVNQMHQTRRCWRARWWSRSSTARLGPVRTHRPARQILGHARRGLARRAALRPAHPRGAARARLRRRRDRAPARRGCDRGALSCCVMAAMTRARRIALRTIMPPRI